MWTRLVPECMVIDKKGFKTGLPQTETTTTTRAAATTAWASRLHRHQSMPMYMYSIVALYIDCLVYKYREM